MDYACYYTYILYGFCHINFGPIYKGLIYASLKEEDSCQSYIFILSSAIPPASGINDLIDLQLFIKIN